MIFAREGRTFGFWNPFQQTSIDAQWMGTWVGVTRLEMISYWLLLVPAAIGVVALRRRRVPLYPLLAFLHHCRGSCWNRDRGPPIQSGRRRASGIARGGRNR